VLYLFAPGGFVIIFILSVLCMSFDFYTVKNVSGRLLVGLRWWNEINEDGTNVWVFESAEDQRQIQPIESLIFWASLYITPALWALFTIMCIIKLNAYWLLVPLVGFALSSANVYGYMKCATEQRTKLQSFAQNYITSTIVGRTTSWFG